jgi:hypothetical protein
MDQAAASFFGERFEDSHCKRDPPSQQRLFEGSSKTCFAVRSTRAAWRWCLFALLVVGVASTCTAGLKPIY